MKQTALVGFSANAELRTKYDRMNPHKKGRLDLFEADLCGTSANVARAINKLGQSSKLLALTGVNGDLETHMLGWVLQNFSLPYSEFPILNQSHIAILPIDGFNDPITFGKKGTIETSKIEETLVKIKMERGQWRIATGVRPAEIILVEELFGRHTGFRSLNPRQELVEDRISFLRILKKTDFLVMNHSEYDACRTTSVAELHQYGPRLIIVTQREFGGMFSLSGFLPERFDVCTDFVSPEIQICNPGSGDWFNAAFHVRCMELGKSINTLDIKDVRECVKFAARVAGKKVTMPGAANGPTKQDLII